MYESRNQNDSQAQASKSGASLKKLTTVARPHAGEGSSSSPTGALGPSVSLHETRPSAGRSQGKKRYILREIPLASVRGVQAAIVHSAHLGLLPTHHITINWELGGVVDSVLATGQFLKLLKDAARSRGWKTAHIWVQEHGPRVGSHTHILIHLPACVGNWLARLKPSWLKICGSRKAKGVSKTTRIAGRPLLQSANRGFSEHYRLNVENVVQYVLKHCAQDAAPHVRRRVGMPVPVKGKHVSISQNIHRTARSKCCECNPQRSTTESAENRRA